MDQESKQPGLSPAPACDPAAAHAAATSNLSLRTLACVCAVALITGLGYLMYFGPTYQGDSPSYIVPAQNLLAGHGFLAWNSYPETSRTPGYPLLILCFLWAGLDLKYLVVFQHLLRIILILGTAVFVVSLTASSRQAIIAGVVLCIDLPLLSAANSVLTEALFTFVLCAGVWLLWIGASKIDGCWRYLLPCGLILGFSVLVRPVSLFLFVPAAAYLLLVRRRHRLRAALSFMIAFAILPLLWAARNYHRTGYFTVSTISGFNLLFYRAAGALAMEQPGDFTANVQSQISRLQVQACKDLGAGIYANECSGVPFPIASQHFGRMGSAILKEHPVGLMKLAARGVVVMMLGGDATSLQRITGLNPYAGVRVLLIYTVPALCFALAGLARFWKDNRQFFWFSFLIIGYFVVISAGAEAYSRFRVPIIPMYAILMAAGLNWITAFMSRRHQRHAKSRQ